MQQVKYAGSTNNADSTVVKVLSSDTSLTWLSPAENAVFKISQDAELPEIVFEFHTQVAGDYKWSWTIEWEAKVSGLRERARKDNILQTFKESGSFVSNTRSWTVGFSEKVLGGTLTVKVSVGAKTLTRTVVIKGQNPSAQSVATYIATLDDMTGFEKLLEQETNSRHFINFDGEPIAAFDKGYGITQMTNPVPTYEQVWNWKANILAGSSIYKDKVRIAKKYLGQAGRAYTDDQLQHEVFSRWNGGSYHEWNATSASWVRKKNILCDSNTGNIGWSMDKEKNTGQTEAELRERDKDTYSRGIKGQSDDHPWEYKGVCYADHVLGE
ncbi:hypothetical protein IMF27_23860 [Pseudomonas sp. PCH199]|uniref:hypothetical protein n=1 Tax=unclassified Pseudomonas TaxID=196821 RepID=UPI000BDD6B5B|nr:MULTISPECIES: hypothetical protein [unclassified Pseudomonas]MCW8278233.1 hypothetical protein [Pseudomonas sp. PCH199]PAM81538.1 hypothetical protein CES87_24350 [Pseudomonas sp. ERMR1:02]